MEEKKDNRVERILKIILGVEVLPEWLQNQIAERRKKEVAHAEKQQN